MPHTRGSRFDRFEWFVIGFASGWLFALAFAFWRVKDFIEATQP